ncbi:hypothetical protein HHA04nite_22080 [Halomonas halophila]|uniref:N-acetyltransferase domain-containing protein n=1 Tax=Halomonas halophila TaxID=29573 RepID=A0ABQ0U547_9GAMM|nr:hypothetical protein HHA04nite_22080 [Halomonas halophila]
MRLDFDGCFYMVGCEREGLAGRLLNNGRVDVVEVGFVPQDEIFYLGNVFVQPSGYGEGFPHTLADALVSDMRVIIDKGEYLKYGLWKMDCDAKMIAQGWLEVVAGSEAREKVSAKAVLSLYVSAFYSTSCFSEGV